MYLIERSKRKGMSLITALMSLLYSDIGNTIEPIVIAINENAPPSFAVKKILQQAYNAIGVPTEFYVIPHRRSIVHVNDGLVDAEAFRIKGIEKTFENLVMVNVPIRTDSMYLYVKKENVFNVDGYESIPKNYIVSYRRGILFLEYAFEKHQIQSNQLTSVNQIVFHLDSGRSDVVILGETGLDLFTQLGVSDVVRLEPPIHDTVLYHYLHKSNQHLLPALTAALEKMKMSGELKEINTRPPILNQ